MAELSTLGQDTTPDPPTDSEQTCGLVERYFKAIAFFCGIAILGMLSAAYIYFAMFSNSLREYYQGIQNPGMSGRATFICAVLYIAAILSIGRLLVLLLSPLALRRFRISFAESTLMLICWMAIGIAQLCATVDAWIWYNRFETSGPENLGRDCFIWRAVATVMLVTEALGLCINVLLSGSATKMRGTGNAQIRGLRPQQEEPFSTQSPVLTQMYGLESTSIP
jgi:hypothetical protein